ncbi:MAG TPA: hypothetical protein P5141_12370 [Candidatus Hydrogenedentes bacterium]|nr:hypothetical protein [Candidatus Hydrogenedentota bacterium]
MFDIWFNHERRNEMKTAIYIEDGTVQLVITPESDFEKDAMRTFGEGPVRAQMFRGTFYDCRGGWVRQSEYNAHLHDLSSDQGDRSLILRMSNKALTDSGANP